MLHFLWCDENLLFVNHSSTTKKPTVISFLEKVLSRVFSLSLLRRNRNVIITRAFRIKFQLEIYYFFIIFQLSWYIVAEQIIYRLCLSRLNRIFWFCWFIVEFRLISICNASMISFSRTPQHDPTNRTYESYSILMWCYVKKRLITNCACNRLMLEFDGEQWAFNLV